MQLEYPMAYAEQLANLQADQEGDPDVRPILAWKAERVGRPFWAEVRSYGTTTRTFWQIWDQLEIRDGILIRQEPDGNVQGGRRRLVIPVQKGRLMLAAEQEHKLTDRLEVITKLKNFKQNYYWPGMKKDMDHWYKQCVPGQCVKTQMINGKQKPKQEGIRPQTAWTDRVTKAPGCNIHTNEAWQRPRLSESKGTESYVGSICTIIGKYSENTQEKTVGWPAADSRAGAVAQGGPGY